MTRYCGRVPYHGMSVQTLTQTGSQDVSKPGMRDHWSRTPLRRRRSFQRLYRTRSVPTGHFYRKEPPHSADEEGEWCLVSNHGDRHKLPKTMIFLGREECDIEVQSQSVDKRHAVVTFDTYVKRFKIKDLSTETGTYVSGTRIPEQEYVILDELDTVHLGYDHSIVFKMERFEEDKQRAGKSEVIYDDETSSSAIDLSHHGNQNGNHDNTLPSWASHAATEEDMASPLAECQQAPVGYFYACFPKNVLGCIVEQRIEHTCGEHNTELDSAHRDLDRSYSESSIASFSLGCNTWPKKRHKGTTSKKTVTEIFAAMDEERSHVDGLIDHPPPSRVLRGTGAPMNRLPDELSTVKQGTPLYGQPKWWGEEDSDLNLERQRPRGDHMADPQPQQQPHRADVSAERRRSDVSLQSSDAKSHVISSNVPNTNTTPVVPYSDPNKTCTTPEGVTNMAFTVDFGDDSKSSLEGRSLGDFMPPKLRKSFRERQEKSHEKLAMIKPSNDNVNPVQERHEKGQEKQVGSKPSSNTVTPEKVKSAEEKLAVIKPSSDNVTPRERLEKGHEKLAMSNLSSENVTQEKVRSAGEKSRPVKTAADKIMMSVGGRAVSEGRDISLTKQHAIDELWASPSDALVSKRQRTMSKSSSSNSVDDENTEQSYSSATKSSSVKRRVLTSISLTKPKSVIRARKAVSQEVLGPPTQATNSNMAFLIDKMFQNNSTGSVDSLKTKDTNRSGLTEYDMYSESVKYDTDQSKLSMSMDFSNIGSKPSSKPSDKPVIKKVRSKEIIPSTILKKSSIEELPVQVEEDKASEAGTYTIEDETDATEETEARKNIDKVFGVDQNSGTASAGDNLSDDIKEQLRQTDKQGELTLSLKNLNLELEEIERLERLRAQPKMANSLEAELGSTVTDNDEEMDDEENPSVPHNAPDWVSQWAALTNQKAQNKSGDMELSSPGSSISDVSEGKSGRVANGLSRKRPGTGRRLPTIPPNAPSPTMSDRSATKDSPRTSICDLKINGTTATLQSPQQQKAVKISSHVSARYQDTDSESVSLTKYGSDLDSARDLSVRGKGSSNTSVASLDTDVLLRDTETVMHAMEERQKNPHKNLKKSSKEENSYDQNSFLRDCKRYADDSSYLQTVGSLGDNCGDEDSAIFDESADLESDTSSVVALVNGDEDFVKPSLYKSPRDVLGKGKFKLTESLPSKPLVNMNGASKTKTSEGVKERKKSVDEGKYVISDIMSDLVDTSRTNDSFDSESSQFSRQGSKGKGQMSMTRPNRAFALRRAMADGDEPLDTARSTSSTTSIASSGFKTPRGGSLSNLHKSGGSTPQKPKRPMSGVFSDRNQPDSSKSQAADSSRSQAPDSSRSNASLGTQIVKKSRENLNRSDGGRHSLRVSRSLSIPVQQQNVHAPAASAAPKQRRSDGSSASSSSLHHSKSLRVTGVSARERSSSISKSDHNSPKAAERNAWKRRKDYDPRQAVLEAKSKPRSESKRRSEGVETFNKARGVTRSASFNNGKDLKLSSYKSDSVSSTEEHSRRSSEASDVFEDRRGFVPYSGRSLLSGKISTSSADEEEVDRSAHSSSAQSNLSYDSLIVSSIYQLSLKLKMQTDRTMDKLRETDSVENGLDSPLDEIDNQSAISEIPAYKSANQELAGVLKNLRKLEQHIKVMTRVLFPEDEGSPDTSKEKQDYLQEIQRIKNELAGFQPIETPRDENWKQDETASVESDCEELSHAEFY
ncbi:centrosomal protein of 170 kDa protein B-like isoform X3 [Dreissena polymorpha]|uniref:centrosomal protein of 170 kDa protein B-like isoform X3 n=1 Tax=Dreissena polymorpha TaxID=45954 RepID=UPI0022641D13|nr:centrosomal protein of 170 kDa protein B-like isoform X3 [Dreissena polymorpha]